MASALHLGVEPFSEPAPGPASPAGSVGSESDEPGPVCITSLDELYDTCRRLYQEESLVYRGVALIRFESPTITLPALWNEYPPDDVQFNKGAHLCFCQHPLRIFHQFKYRRSPTPYTKPDQDAPDRVINSTEEAKQLLIQFTQKSVLTQTQVARPFPWPTACLPPDPKLDAYETVFGMNASLHYVNYGESPHEANAGVWCLGMIYLLRGGSPMIHVAVDPRDNETVWEKVQALLANTKSPRRKRRGYGGAYCSQFTRHEAAFPSIEMLEQMMVRYRIVVQHPGEIVVFMPETHHFTYSTGTNHYEQISWADPGWTPGTGRFVDCAKWSCGHNPEMAAPILKDSADSQDYP